MSSLRVRLGAIYLGLIVVGFGGLTLFAGQTLAASTMDDFGNNLQRNVFLLATQLVEPLEDNPSAASRIIADNSEALGGQIALYDRQAEWQESSDGQPVLLMAGEQYVVADNAAGEPTVFAAADVIYEGRSLGVVQVGVPAAVPQATIRQRWATLGGVFIGFTLIGLLVSFWLLNSLTRPLSNLESAANHMAGGDLSQRVTALPNDEIGAVGHAFNEMADRIEAMINEQRAFASNASHELRTPLTTIRLHAEGLQVGRLDEAESQQYLDDITSEIDRMSLLLDDLMLLSRLDARRLAAGDEVIDVARLLRGLERSLGPRIVAEKLTLNLMLPEQELIARGSMNHIRIVLRNVLENAIKYTPAGGTISASLAIHQSMLQFSVVDTGRGISPDDLPHVAKRFYRTDKAHSRDIDGSGLGLALVVSILALYNGAFQIDSAGVDQGTTVTIQWPLVQGG